MMNRSWKPAALVLSLLATWLPTQVLAVEGSWSTSAGVGPNEVVYTLDLSCPNFGFVCDLLDGYSEQDTSTLGGAGMLDLEDGIDGLQFQSDSLQDVGSGPQAAYTTLTGTDLTFPNIPFAGVPEITNLLVFALSNPLIDVPGLDLMTPGDYPFSQTIGYSGTGLVVGDLEFILGPNLVAPPDDILVTGTLRILGDVGSNGTLDYELRDVTGSFSFQNLTTIGGEAVTVDVTADLTMNLAGATGAPSVPAVGPLGWLALVALLGATASASQRAVEPIGKGKRS